MITKVDAARPRVLLLAFMCSPDHGSEWANGWNRALQSAKNFDTWVICQGDQQQVEIERYLAAHGPIPGLQFEFLSYRPRDTKLRQHRALAWLLYNRWQKRALRLAEQLHQQHCFELVHMVTNTGFREPGYLWKLDAPFVWGPIGGTHNYPWNFLAEAGPAGAAIEAVRSVANSFQLRWSRRVRRAARRTSAMLAANTTARDQFERAHGVRPIVMTDVAPATLGASPREFRADSGPLKILWSGQFVPRKALSLLLKALAQLPGGVEYRLRVLGGGMMERRWKRLAARLGIHDRIEWMGWLPYQEAQHQYGWADLFVFTSLRDCMGSVSLEAMANGLPVVCLDHQGVHDTVSEKCGIKVPVINRRQVVDDLAVAVARMARDPALRYSMSRAATERARMYLWPQLGAQMTEVYREVLERNGIHGDGVELPAEHSADDTSTIRSPDGNGVRRPAPAVSRSRLRAAAGWGARQVATGLHTLFGDRTDNTFGILMYHRVTNRVEGVAPPTWNVTPAQLRRQLEGLLDRGFEPWSLRKLIAAQRESRPIPPKIFAVTFDDGYANNYTQALPILRELRIPATIFLATKYLGTNRPFPFDDWSATGSSRVPADAWRPLMFEECEQLQDSGLVELGAHTHTHQNYVGRTAEFRRDMSESLALLERRLRIVRPTFAFPFGATTPELIVAAKEAGVLCAFTTRAQCVAQGTNPFFWGRFAAENADTPATLAAKLAGWYTPVVGTLSAIRRPMRRRAANPGVGATPLLTGQAGNRTALR